MTLRQLIILVFAVMSIASHGQSLLMPGTTVFQNYSNGEYKDSLLITFDYTINDNNNCRLDQETWWSHSINQEVWLKQQIKHWEYDQNDHITTYDNSYYNKTSGKWGSSIQYYSYTGNLLSKITSYSPNKYAGNDVNTVVYSYDETNRVTQILNQTYYTHAYEQHPTRKIKYIYDTEGKLMADTSFHWSTSFFMYENNSYHYNQLNQLDSVFYVHNLFPSYEYKLTTYQYNEAGLRSERILYNWMDQWMPGEKTTYEYDSTFQRHLFQYNYKWNSSTQDWDLVSRIKYQEFCTDELESEILQEQPLFRIYPNPGKELRLLALSDIRNENTLTIRDIQGTPVFIEKFQWPHVDDITNKSRDIPPGFYFISITSDKYRQDMKWIKY